MHKEKMDTQESRYMVVAKLIEPNYAAEFKYLRAEMAFVDKKLTALTKARSWPSIPILGIFTRKDWQKYHHTLGHYAKQLEDYAQDVKHGVLPVKFAVYHDFEQPDQRIVVKVHVEDGRFDTKKQPPSRPERLDKPGQTGKKFDWVRPNGFWRSKITLGPHTIQAQLSALKGHDGATVVNDLIHVHCGPDTNVTYELHSLNVSHESGDVEL